VEGAAVIIKTKITRRKNLKAHMVRGLIDLVENMIKTVIKAAEAVVTRVVEVEAEEAAVVASRTT